MMQDKIVLQKRSSRESPPQIHQQFPVIIGPSKSVKSQLESRHSTKSHIENDADQILTFDQDINEKKVDIQIPQEELDDIFRSTPDYEEEEEEWSQYQIFDHDNGSAQGVTFEELNTVEALLKNQKLEEAQKETAVDIIQKIHGTELFNLLENSVEGASIKIAELLDTKLSFEINSNSSFLENNNFDEFDIEQFT
ncbi:conjugal transfer protein TraD [Chryseobacterium arachidis]